MIIKQTVIPRKTSSAVNLGVGCISSVWFPNVEIKSQKTQKELKLKDFTDKPNNKSAGDTKQDHCSNRKIKPEIFLFDPYITGQTTDPG